MSNPMLYIREFVDYNNVEIISEAVEGSKSYKITGPFLEGEVKNRNGRIYPVPILEREVKDFYENKIKTKRAIGELDHPSSPSINLDRVSHLIEDLRMDGNVGRGTAKILDTPVGKIAQSLIEGGVKLGVSTRGVGSLTGNKVNDDFKLITVDIVADPSAPSAFVEGIMEGKKYFVDGDHIVEMAYTNLEENLANNGTRDLKRAINNFLFDLKRKL